MIFVLSRLATVWMMSLAMLVRRSKVSATSPGLTVAEAWLADRAKVTPAKNFVKRILEGL